MKKLAKLSPGRIFNFAGEKFVVMEQRDGASFVLLAQSKESCPFNDKDNAENRNDYTRSTLKERIDKWVEALPRTSEEAAAILPFEVDLSCTDRSKSYGTITVKAAPLTLWQYGQFKELIPLNEDGRTIVGDMDFSGSSLDVAVNAIIGSMLQNGYLNVEAREPLNHVPL